MGGEGGELKKTMIVDLGKCTGCEMCMDICSSEQGKSYSDQTSKIQIHKDEAQATFIPLVCEQCREHPCVDACPVNALQYDDPLSIFTVDREACTGCGACVDACPYDGIFLSGKVAVKCDLCGGRVPCVGVCYPQALRYAEVSSSTALQDLECKAAKLKKLGEGSHE